MSRLMFDKFPNDWFYHRFGSLINSIRNEKNNNDGTPVVSLSTGGVKIKEDLSFGMNPTSYIGHQIVKRGDLLICLRDLDGPLLCGVSDFEGCTSNLYFSLIINEKFNPYYVDYVLHMLHDTEMLKKFSYGMRYAYNANQFKSLYYYFPNKEKQNNIVTFLDKKTNHIERLIKIQEQQIEKLKEYKQSVISKAVTKGLDPNALMKDSGIVWIPTINSSYKITKMFNVLSMRITDGPHETPELFSEGIPFISAEAVHNGYIDFTKPRGYISTEYYNYCCEKYVPQLHDIYMVKSGATTGTLAIVETEKIFTIWSPLAVIRANEKIIHYKYLYYVMLSKPFQEQIALRWNYGTQQNIGMRVIETLKVYFPDIRNQRDIVSYIDSKMIKIDKQLDNIERKITMLHEYKKSLIYEYVTGKREVND